MKQDQSQAPTISFFAKELKESVNAFKELPGFYIHKNWGPCYKFYADDFKQANEMLLFLQQRFGERIDCMLTFEYHHGKIDYLCNICFNKFKISRLADLASAIIDFDSDL